MKDSETPRCNMHDALVAYLYDEATPEEADRLRTHLIECALCKQELSEFERVRHMLQSWELEDLPVLRIQADASPKRRFVAVLKEFLLAMPLWAKSIGALATAMLVLSVLGTEVSISRSGIELRLNLIRSAAPEPAAISQAEVEALVTELLAANERQLKADLQSQIARTELALQGAHSSELAKLAARLRQQREKLETLERDIDRREALSLSDLLFSGSERSDSGGGAGQ